MKNQPPDPSAPPLDGDPAHNKPYWDESQVTAAAKVNDGGHPQTLPDQPDSWMVLADAVTLPVRVAGLSEHAHHPAWVLFGYEAEGGQR